MAILPPNPTIADLSNYLQARDAEIAANNILLDQRATILEGGAPAPSLKPLTLSTDALTVNDGSVAVSINGTTIGSTLTANGFPTGMTFSTGARSIYGVPTVPGVYVFDIVETLNGVSRTTALSIEVRATLKFSQALVSVNEGAAGATTAIQLQFERSHAYKGAIGVNWTFTPGTTSANDYVGNAYPVPAPVAVGAGSLNGAIVINVKGDATEEPNEDFVAGLVAPLGYVLVTPSACTGRILNDDAAPDTPPAIALEPNPPGETVGPFNSGGGGTNTLVETNSRKQNASFKPNGQGPDMTFLMSYNNAVNSYNQVTFVSGGVSLKRIVGGQESGDAGGRPMKTAWALTDVYSVVQTDTGIAAYQNGELLHSWPFAAHDGGTKVDVRPWFPGVDVTVGGEATPLRLTKTELNGDLTLTIEADYTGSPDTWQVQKRNSGGLLVDWTDVILISATKGKVKFQTRMPFPASAAGAGVTWLIRQKNDVNVAMPPAQVLTIADPKLTFGVNLTGHTDWWGNVIFRNHIVGWRLREAWDASPQMTRRGDPLENTRSASPFTYILPPRVSGQRMRLRWKGVANFKLEGNAGSSVQNPTNGSGGGWTWIDFNHNFEAIRQITGAYRDGSNLSLTINDAGTGTGANWPSEWDCYPINMDGTPISTGRFDKAFLDDAALYATAGGLSPFRTMDWQGGAGGSDIAFTEDDLGAAGEMGRGWRVSIPDILEFHRLVGKRPRIHIMMSGTEGYVRALARMCRDWAILNNIVVMFELQNEVWNSGQGAWNVARMAGAAKWGGEANNDNAMRYHNFRFNQVMKWVREEFEAVPNATKYMIRIIAGQCDSPGNRWSFCEGQPGDLRAMDECERIDIAPYVAANTAAGINTGTLEGDLQEYQRRILADIIVKHGFSKTWQEYAFANGKAFGCYEGGIENSSANEGLVKAHRLSPLHGEAVTAILNHWQVNLGGFYSWYYDNNPIWGLKTHATQPVAANDDNYPIAHGFNAWKAKMNQVAAAA